MYGSFLYGSALYGSSGQTGMSFYIGKSSVYYTGRPYDLQMYMDFAKSDVVFSSKRARISAIFQLKNSSVDFSGNPIEITPSGSASWSVGLSQTIVTGNPLSYQGYFDLRASKAKFGSHSLKWKTILDMAVAKAFYKGSSLGYTVSGTAYFDLYVSKAFFRGIEMDADYVPLSAVPNLVAQRVGNGSQVSIDVLNPINAQLSITRTGGYLGNQSEIAVVPVNTLPYSDSVDPEGNYRYMATYAIIGERGGQPRIVRSQSSSPRLTFGKNRTL